MAEYMPLKRFKAVYVVDLCHSLCEQAEQKVKQKGWKNVHVVEGDACTFQPPEGIATLVTFSYSLSSGCQLLAASIFASLSKFAIPVQSTGQIQTCLSPCSDSSIPLCNRQSHLILGSQ